MKSLNEMATSIFVEELSRQGIQDVFIAPGSRSTPLVIACANNPKMTIHTHFDERGLGFFALGFSKKSKNPSLIITTSGTAVANLLPAIVEAHYSHTPLIVCSADRPPELINVGANQAITQKDIFKNFVSDYIEIQPVDTSTSLESILTTAGHISMKAAKTAQPIHINWMFREPLAPISATGLKDKSVETPTSIAEWLKTDTPYTQNTPTKNISEFDESVFENTKKTLIILGSMVDESYSESLLKIAAHFNAPVFCDVQNPLRFTEFDQNILRFDLLLETAPIQQPNTIIHIGGPLTSKNLNKFIESSSAHYIQIHDKSSRLDFMHMKKAYIYATPNDIARSLSRTYNSSATYLEQLKNFSNTLNSEISKEFQNSLNEASLPYHLIKNFSDTEMFFGSSMPIRDLERFAGATNKISCTFNRGASGIDGNVATAAGAAIASKKKYICVLGDQAFLYDLNSLALIKSCKQTFHTVVVNNQGGGIFSFLPVAKIDKSKMDKYFTHPHEWNIKSAAETFHLKYILVQNPQELISALESNASSVIEMKSDIATNVKMHREITRKLKELYE